jgi:hypothetical protein
MHVFSLGRHILGFKLSNFILKLVGRNYGLKSKSEKIELLIGNSHPLRVSPYAP